MFIYPGQEEVGDNQITDCKGWGGSRDAVAVTVLGAYCLHHLQSVTRSSGALKLEDIRPKETA